MKTESYNIKIVDDVPGLHPEKDSRIIYIVGEYKPWCLVFLCPCGCKAFTQLPLVGSHPNLWNFKLNDGITIHPSINRTDGCKSHYFIRQGKVQWC